MSYRIIEMYHVKFPKNLDSLFVFIFFILEMYFLLQQVCLFMMKFLVYYPFNCLMHFHHLLKHFPNHHKQLFEVIRYFAISKLTQVLLVPFLRPSIHVLVFFVLLSQLFLLFVILYLLVFPLNLFIFYLELPFIDF